MTAVKIKNRYIRYLCNPEYRFVVNAARGMYKDMPDEEYLKKMFKAKLGYDLNLEKPRSYNEKLQWLKLFDRNPVYATMVDKYAAKEYIAGIIGEQHIIPTLGVWARFDDIDFSVLPNQFVLKCTHDSGGLVICQDKSQLDLPAAKNKIVHSMKRDYFSVYREWPYKNVKPRIIAEKYIGSIKNDGMNTAAVPNDYKIYTFNGKAKLCMINQNRGTHTTADYFDRNFQWMDFKWGYDHAESKPQKPENYELMFEFAEKIARNSYEMRVDFYQADGQVYFGEVTFFDGGGFDRFVPIEWDYMLGDWIVLPK